MKQQHDLYPRNLDDTPRKWRIDRDYPDRVIAEGVNLLRDAEYDSGCLRIGLELSQKGFVLVDNAELGLDNNFLLVANALFDNPDIVKSHSGDVPPTRRRARDVVTWQLDGSQVILGRFSTNTIEDETRSGRDGRVDIHYNYRDISRFDALSEDAFVTYLATLLSVMPDSLRYGGGFEPTEIHYGLGTLSVNAFETYDEVVRNKLHHDKARIIATTVIDKQGEGAHSLLQEVKTGEMVLDQPLEPGQTLLFFDEVFRHGATDLRGPAPRRRALITTLDLLDTYY